MAIESSCQEGGPPAEEEGHSYLGHVQKQCRVESINICSLEGRGITGRRSPEIVLRTQSTKTGCTALTQRLAPK